MGSLPFYVSFSPWASSFLVLYFFSRSAFERYHITALHNFFFAREHIACLHRIAYLGVCLGGSLQACGFLFFSFVGDKTEAFVFGFGFGLCVFMLLLLCWLLLVWLKDGCLPWLLIPHSLAALWRAGGQVFRIWMEWDGMGWDRTGGLG